MIKNYIKYYIKKIFNLDNENWCFGLLYGDISLSNLKKIKIFEKPTDEFWADPFFVKHKKKNMYFLKNLKKNKTREFFLLVKLKTINS